MKYYLHDTNSFNDDKITELFITYGYEGLGLFYTVLERLAAQEKPVKTHVLKSQLKVGKRLEKCWFFMESIGLIHSFNGETFNKRMTNYCETFKKKKEKNSKRVLKWRDNQYYNENVTHYESNSNTTKLNLNKSKVNKSNNIENKEDINLKEKILIPKIEDIKSYCNERKNSVDFESFFNYYESIGWMVGKNKLKDWRACVRGWEKRTDLSNKSKTGDTKQRIAGNIAKLTGRDQVNM